MFIDKSKPKHYVQRIDESKTSIGYLSLRPACRRAKKTHIMTPCYCKSLRISFSLSSLIGFTKSKVSVTNTLRGVKMPVER